MYARMVDRGVSPRRLVPLAAFIAACLATPSLALDGPWLRGHILEVQRIDAGRGWALTDSELLRTQDGAATWTAVTPARGLDGATSMSFLDGSRGWLGGVNAQHAGRLDVLATDDGGRSWTAVHVPAAALERDGAYVRAQILFADAQHGWLLGQVATGSAFSVGRLLRTADGGKTWELLPQPPAAGRLRFVDAARGFMAGAPVAEKLHATEDGGRTWREISLVPGYALYGLPVFQSAAAGSVAVTLPGGSPRLEIFLTRDGGRTWSLDASVDLPAGDYSEPVPAVFDSAGHLAAMAVEGGLALGAGAKPTFLGDASVRDLWLSGTSGWALLAEGACDSRTCDQTTRLVALDAAAAGGAPRDALIRTFSEARQEGAISLLGATTSFAKGFDKCSAGTTAQMQTWRTYSPYQDANIYYGGVSRGCTQPNLSSSWVSAVFSQGWRLIPTWVGPQAPCSGYANKISTDPTTARNQGLADGDSAVNAASALGLGSGTPLYFDMENYNETIASCNDGVRAFINAWVERVKSRGYVAGVYANAYDAQHDMTSSIITNPPDAAWLASWVCTGGTSCSWAPTVWGIPGLSDSYWVNNQRIRQYWGQHNDTYGGVLFAVDSDYANGPVATSGGGGGGTFTCDDGDSCFALFGPAQYWHRETACGGTSVGNGGDLYWTYVNGTVVSNSARWTPNFSGTGGAGNYTVSVFIPRCYGTSQQARYRIYHNGVSDYATVNQNAAYDAWVTLGTYSFANNGTEYVELTDATGESYSTLRQLSFDAVRFVK